MRITHDSIPSCAGNHYWHLMLILMLLNGLIGKALTDTLSKSLGISDKFISLSIEDILKEDWVEDVYKPEIIGKSNNLYKKPGYDPL